MNVKTFGLTHILFLSLELLLYNEKLEFLKATPIVVRLISMSNSRRVSRVAAQIKREISQIILHEIKDERVLSGMVTVTDVDISGDLQHAKVFVSIYGAKDVKASSMAGIKSVTPEIRNHLAHRMRLRRTPELVFMEDNSLEKTTHVLTLLNHLNLQRQNQLDDCSSVQPYSLD